MKRRTRHTLTLLGLVLVLAGLAMTQWNHDRAAAPGTLLPLDPDAITRIEVAPHGQPVQHYVHRDGHWWRTDGARATHADDGRLADIAGIAAAPVAEWRPASDFDPAHIGLAPPDLVLTLDGRRLEYGAMAPFGTQRYVRVGGRVAIIPAQYAPRPPGQKPLDLK